MEVEGKRAVVFVYACRRLYRGARGRSGVLRPDRYLRPGLLRGASVAQTRACDGRGLGLFLTTMANTWTSLLKNGSRQLPRTPQRQLRGLGQGPSLGISYGRTKARTAYNYKTVRLCSFHHNLTAMSDNPSFVLTGVENTKFEQRAVPKAGPGEVIVAIKKTGACVPLHKAWRTNGADVRYLWVRCGHYSFFFRGGILTMLVGPLPNPWTHRGLRR